MDKIVFDFKDAVAENIVRLVADAHYLNQDNRHASAFALALIAMEEVGKLILRVWEEAGMKPTRKRRTQHLQKQAAVACVMLAGSILPSLKQARCSSKENEEALVKLIASEMMRSKEGVFLRISEIGATDRTKQLALYVDGEPISPELQRKKFRCKRRS